MKQRIQHLVTAVIAMIAMFTVTSCDKDNVDELTSTLWDTTWSADNGEVYAFYKTFNGVIYADGDDYENHKIDKSFVWTTTSDANLNIAISGYRTADGKWEEVDSKDYKVITYEVSYDNNGDMILKSNGITIVMTKLKN